MILLGWEQRRVDLVLANADVWALMDRARRFDVDAGGRYDIRGGGRIVFLWSAAADPGDRPLPIAAFSVKWRTPTRDQATVWRLAWDPDLSTEAEAWRAVEVLLGRALR